MLIRVLSRGLFFRRGSQVDFAGGPLGDRKVNVEDIKVVHPLGDSVAKTGTLEVGPLKVRLVCERGNGSADRYIAGIRDAAESCPSQCEFYTPSLSSFYSKRRQSVLKISVMRTTLPSLELFWVDPTVRARASTIR